MKIIEKNILDIEAGIIFQQVNCQKKMASGLAKSIRDKWPLVYDTYIDSFQKKQDFQMLGEYVFLKVSKDVFVCSVFGQLLYGYDGQRYTDYAALNQAFKTFKNKYFDYWGCPQIYFPFNFGSFRGGGDWKIISKMIDFYFPDAIICKLAE